MKINAANGNDSAFWLLDPGKFEIDAPEAFYPNVILQNIYNHVSGQEYRSVLHPEFTAKKLSDGYHIFGVYWDSWGVRWYVDGVQTHAVACDFCDAPATVRLTSHTRYPLNVYGLEVFPVPGLNGTETSFSWVRIY